MYSVLLTYIVYTYISKSCVCIICGTGSLHTQICDSNIYSYLSQYLAGVCVCVFLCYECNVERRRNLVIHPPIDVHLFKSFDSHNQAEQKRKYTYNRKRRPCICDNRMRFLFLFI